MYWKYASILIFAIFCLWVFVEVKLRSGKEDVNEAAFWKRELKSNSVRKKPIENLGYVVISENLPYDAVKGNDEIDACLATLEELKGEKILNLTGWSNTDIKMEYGVANLTVLSAADDNYTSLVTTLQKWADELLKLNMAKEAVTVMEFAVSTGTDVGKTYRLLADFYLKEGNREAVDKLMETAKGLKTLNQKAIVRSLTELCESYSTEASS